MLGAVTSGRWRPSPGRVFGMDQSPALCAPLRRFKNPFMYGLVLCIDSLRRPPFPTCAPRLKRETAFRRCGSRFRGRHWSLAQRRVSVSSPFSPPRPPAKARRERSPPSPLPWAPRGVWRLRSGASGAALKTAAEGGGAGTGGRFHNLGYCGLVAASRVSGGARRAAQSAGGGGGGGGGDVAEEACGGAELALGHCWAGVRRRRGQWPCQARSVDKERQERHIRALSLKTCQSAPCGRAQAAAPIRRPGWKP